MSFFNRKKRRPYVAIHAISPSSQVRKIIYDSGCKEPERIAGMMGLNPLSEEVSDMEQNDSEIRVARLAPILPVIEAHSYISAQVSAMAYAISAKDEDGDELDPEMLDALTQLFQYVSLSSAISCISTMVDLSLISEGYRNV